MSRFYPLSPGRARVHNNLGAACTVGTPGYIDAGGLAQPATAATRFDFIFAETVAAAGIGDPVQVWGPENLFVGTCSGTVVQTDLGITECDIEVAAGEWFLNENATNIQVARLLEMYGGDVVATAEARVVFQLTRSQLSGEGANSAKLGIDNDFAGDIEIAGTLDVTGATILDDTCGVQGNFAVGAVLARTFEVTAATGDTQVDGDATIDGTCGVAGDLSVGAAGARTCVVTAATGNIDNDGDIETTGTVAAVAALEAGVAGARTFTVAGGTGNVMADGVLNNVGNVHVGAVADPTFAVTAADGSVRVGTVGVPVVTIAGATGNTEIVGTLDVTGVATLDDTCGIEGDFAVGDPLGRTFTVTAATGNVAAGDLAVGAVNAADQVTGVSYAAGANPTQAEYGDLIDALVERGLLTRT